MCNQVKSINRSVVLTTGLLAFCMAGVIHAASGSDNAQTLASEQGILGIQKAGYITIATADTEEYAEEPDDMDDSADSEEIDNSADSSDDMEESEDDSAEDDSGADEEGGQEAE